MERLQFFGVIALILMSACVAATPDEPQSTTSSPKRAGTETPVSAQRSGTKLPKNFTDYASESSETDRLCVVGAVTDDDGLNQKPLIYAAKIKSKRIVWIDQLGLPANAFQSRATHCSSSNEFLFVLLQSDTQSEQTLSQTFLQILKVRANSGEVLDRYDVTVPNAYTVWVGEGAGNFQLTAGVLLISGNFRTQSNQDSQKPFTVRLSENLKPLESGKP